MQSAGGVGGLLWSEEANGDVHYYGFDGNGNGNGNVVVTVNAATGQKSSEYAYSPFGETIQATGAYAGVNRYRFSTKPQERESGFYYYGYRFFDPAHGRWLGRDPIGENGGLNIYGFVQNNPTGFIDVLGLDSFDHGN